MSGVSGVRVRSGLATQAAFFAIVAAVVIAALGGACGSSPTAPTVQPTPVPTPTPTPTPSPPTVACPSPVSQVSPLNVPIQVTWPTPTAEGGQSPVNVECTPRPGSMFPIGTTKVECVATDALSRTGSCAFSVTVVGPPQLRRTRLMAFGDSITAGEVAVPASGVTPAGVPSVKLVQVISAAYPTVLQQLLAARYTAQTASLVVFNEGLSGEKAEDALARFIQRFNADRPEVVLLMEGYNDICCGNGSVGIRRAERGLSDMAAEARNRGARVFIATLAPPKSGSRSTPIETVQAMNDRIREVARGEGAYLVDVYSALLPDLAVNIGIDGLHPTEIGYRRIAGAFFAAVLDDLEIR